MRDVSVSTRRYPSFNYELPDGRTLDIVRVLSTCAMRIPRAMCTHCSPLARLSLSVCL